MAAYGLLSALPQLEPCVDKLVEMPGDKMIDWERVSDLRSEIGEEGFGEVVELFLEETDDVIARLSMAPSPIQIGKDMHFLKGSALNLGFRNLASLCQDGERRAGLGDAPSIDLGAIIRAYQDSKSAFLMGKAQGPQNRSSAA